MKKNIIKLTVLFGLIACCVDAATVKKMKESPVDHVNATLVPLESSAKWGASVDMIGAFSSKDKEESGANCIGWDLTGSYYIQSETELYFQWRWMSGTITHQWYSDESYSHMVEERDYTRTENVLFVGANRYFTLNERWDAYVGAKFGLALTQSEWEQGDSENASGFAYGIGFGVRYHINERSSVKLGYEFYGSTAEIKEEGETVVDAQTYHVVSIGYEYRF